MKYVSPMICPKPIFISFKSELRGRVRKFVPNILLIKSACFSPTSEI